VTRAAVKPRVENRASHVSKGNVLDDLGFSPAQTSALKLKADVLSIILDEIAAKQYTARDLVEKLDEYQPQVSNLMRGKVSKMSLEKLLAYCGRLGIVVALGFPPNECAIRLQSGKAEWQTAESQGAVHKGEDLRKLLWQGLYEDACARLYDQVRVAERRAVECATTATTSQANVEAEFARLADQVRVAERRAAECAVTAAASHASVEAEFARLALQLGASRSATTATTLQASVEAEFVRLADQMRTAELKAAESAITAAASRGWFEAEFMRLTDHLRVAERAITAATCKTKGALEDHKKEKRAAPNLVSSRRDRSPMA